MNVLVLEAGGRLLYFSDVTLTNNETVVSIRVLLTYLLVDLQSDLNVGIAQLIGLFSPMVVDWNYTTEAQADFGLHPISLPRGKVLGGTSALNGLWAQTSFSRVFIEPI